MLTTRLTFLHRPRWLAISLCVLSGCAQLDSAGERGWTVGDTVPPADVPGGVVDEPVPSNPAMIELLSCTLESSQLAETWWVEPHFHAFLPNEGLFVSGAGLNDDMVSLSIPDGAVFRTHDMLGLRAVDENWTVGAFFSHPEAQIRNLNTGDVLARTEGPVAAVAVTPDARKAAMAVCDENATNIVIVDLEAGTQRSASVDPGAPCYRWSNTLNRIRFTDDGRYLAFVSISGALISVDTETFATVAIQPHLAPEGPYYHTVVSDMAVRPGAHEVVTTGIDGVLRRFSLPALQQIGEDVVVGSFRINELTYAPQYIVSPVAFTPDGATLAYVDLNGDIVVANAAGTSVLETPPAQEQWLESGRTANVPVTLTFGPSGRRLGVGYYWGTAVWGCPGDPVSRTGAIELTVPGVVDRDASGGVRIPMTIDGAGPLTAIRVSGTNGELQSYRLDDGALGIWLGSEHTGDLTVEVDDGFGRASATVRVRLTQ